jgi:hypothetical protein
VNPSEEKPFTVGVDDETFGELDAIYSAVRVAQLLSRPKPLTESEKRRKEKAVASRRARNKAAKAARRRNRI